jgi:hypothetical protein
MLLRVPFKLFTLEGIRRYLGQVLAGWQEAAQQPILIKRSFILPDELLNLLELEIDGLANWRSSLFRASFRGAYILEMLNLEDIPNAYAFAIEKFSSRRQQRVLNSSSNA